MNQLISDWNASSTRAFGIEVITVDGERCFLRRDEGEWIVTPTDLRSRGSILAAGATRERALLSLAAKVLADPKRGTAQAHVGRAPASVPATATEVAAIETRKWSALVADLIADQERELVITVDEEPLSIKDRVRAAIGDAARRYRAEKSERGRS